jgi:hypothetical protein
MKGLYKKILANAARTDFVSSAINEQADLSAFKEKPSLAVITGVLLIIIASLLGWPAVALLGIIAIKLNEPLIAVIGAPLVYGLSHLVFLLGMYFSGAEYSVIFTRWLVRVIMEKLLAGANPEEA